MGKAPALFDANGSFGKKSSGSPEFPTIADRLAFMDRFGIARSLVWNVESTQNHAGRSNRMMLDQIRRTPGARGRIIPALSVSGLMPYEEGGLEELVGQMREGGTRALRFANVFGRLTLRQLEPVMKVIRKRKPFIVLRFDQAGVEDLAAFAEQYPDVSLILTEVMWGPCITVFDLMRRRKNILVDLSWMHTFDAVELLADQFGADRIVFGTGYKSHNGAAIAALARAHIAESQRRLIACGNLERLTGLAPRVPVPAVETPGNTLWNRFLAGRPLGVDAIDSHVHAGPSGGYVLKAQEESKQIALAVKAMDAVGIDTMIISGLQALMGGPVEGNDLLESLLTPLSARMKGYVTFNPFYADELLPRLDGYFGGSVFVGFKTLCDYWNIAINDPRFDPMWKYADRHRLPVLNHTWTGTRSSPAMLTDVVKRFPNVQFLLAHSGGSDQGRGEAVKLAQDNKNVFLEWCGSFCSSIPWEETLRQVDHRQVVFGTDAMAHDINWELGRLLSLNVSDKVLIPILGGNMRRILAMRR
ncbi:MAG: amidohydrolase family protein [Kiritimatiellia bacterium]